MADGEQKDQPPSAEEAVKRFVPAESLEGAEIPAWESRQTKPEEPAAEAEEGEEEQEEGQQQEAATEGEESEEGEQQASGEEGEEGEEEEPEEESKDKSKKTVQQRINELTRERREAERRAQEAERQLAEQRQSQSPEGQQGQEGLTDGQDQSKQGQSAPPKPEDYTYGEVDPDYQSALVEYKVNERLSSFEQKLQEERQREAAEKQNQELAQKWEQQTQAGKEKYSDFEEKVVLGASEGNWKLSEDMGKLVLDSPVGADVAYYLASNPGEADKIYNKDPSEQARIFGRLEAQFSSSSEDAKPKKKATQAPPPTKQTRGRSGKFEVNPNTEDFESFKKRYGPGG